MHWGYQQVWVSALRPLLFWMGDTEDLLAISEEDVARDNGTTVGPMVEMPVGDDP
jgi:hypothetical protein